MKVRTWPVSGVVLAVLWLFVRGVGTDPSALLGEFLLGLALGLPVSYAFRRLYVRRTDPVRALRAAPYAVLYAAAFVRELLTANLDVAYRTLAPGMPIEPRVVVFPLRVETDVAITSIANSITLTPGTLTMDYDAGTNALYVHTIDGRDPEAVVAPIRAWEDYALVIFDEELKPGDPVPGEVVVEEATGEAESGPGRPGEAEPGHGDGHGRADGGREGSPGRADDGPDSDPDDGPDDGRRRSDDGPDDGRGGDGDGV